MSDSDSRIPMQKLQTATREYYAEYAARKGVNRNSLLRNPEVLFQTLARDAATVRALSWINPDPQSTQVLDVGCGDGDSLWTFQRLGFEPSNLFGVDIQEERILRARATNPLVNFECADATVLKFADDAFDITMESMILLQVPDDGVAGRIASEMIRVTKRGGFVLISDWRYSKPGSEEFKGVSRKRIERLYNVGVDTYVCNAFRGALAPPIGRFLSKFCSPSYFLIQALFPFLTAQTVTILQKSEGV